ncbi:uncharacterized protein LOC141691844 [Apium graveolens]|uniref:uncharacterized protein LOC141691844 n=1 Tax=Apium graveolens TaxID=4045 RepID=UPI003D79AAE4
MEREAGGLAFRDLQGFNMALLGKQYWNFMHNPESLAARVFKARYFPETSFFEATRGGGASYTWSGIWQAKESLKRGYRWVVGDGKSINVGTDAWIRGKSGHYIEEQYVNSVSGLKVCDLFISGTKDWDVTKVYNLFSSSDASCILAIPVPKHQFHDRIIWNHSVNGIYSAKTGYKFWHQQFSTCKQLEISKDWLLQVLTSESYEKLAHIATVLWGIWTTRNLKVWEDKLLTTQMAMQMSVLHVKQWRDSQQLKLVRDNACGRISEVTVATWKPPEEGRLKINVDAHIIAGCHWFSCGLILRNHAGNFIRAQVGKLAGNIPVVKAEAT